MNYINSGLLSTYNSLTDKHLAGYFNNTRIRRHLQRVGLITRSGRIVPDKEYRLKLIRRDHQKHVRECLAQAIFHKVLDMERHHQIEIKRKLEDFARRERVHKIKVERSKRYDEDIIPLLSPKPPSGPRNRHQQPSGPEGEHSESSESHGSSRPNTAPGKMQRPHRLQPINRHIASVRRTSPGYKRRDSSEDTEPQQDNDLRPVPMTNEFSRGISPYQLPIINNYITPVPPSTKRTLKGAPNGTTRGRRLRPTTAPVPAVEKQDSKSSKTSVHSNVSVTMVYYGKTVHLSHDNMDMRDEVKVFQQHCGGENVCIYKGRLMEGEAFQFVSRRHRGFPFSLTFFLNGLQVDRLSSCCEFKHRKGSRLGGKHGHFGFSGVDGASPCYKCIISMGLDKKPSPPKRTKEETTKDTGTPEEMAEEAKVVEEEIITQDIQSHLESELRKAQVEDDSMETEANNIDQGKAKDDYDEDFEADDERADEDMEEAKPLAVDPSSPCDKKDSQINDKEAAEIVNHQAENEEKYSGSEFEEDDKPEDKKSLSGSYRSSSLSSRDDSDSEAEEVNEAVKNDEGQSENEKGEPPEEQLQVEETETTSAFVAEKSDDHKNETCSPTPPETTATTTGDAEAQDCHRDGTDTAGKELLDNSMHPQEEKEVGKSGAAVDSGDSAAKPEECVGDTEPERAKSVQGKLVEAIMKEAQSSSEPELSDTSTEEEDVPAEIKTLEQKNADEHKEETDAVPQQKAGVEEEKLEDTENAEEQRDTENKDYSMEEMENSESREALAKESVDCAQVQEVRSAKENASEAGSFKAEETEAELDSSNVTREAEETVANTEKHEATDDSEKVVKEEMEDTEAQIKETIAQKESSETQAEASKTEVTEAHADETKAEEKKTEAEETEEQAEGTEAQPKETEGHQKEIEAQADVTDSKAEDTKTLSETSEAQPNGTEEQEEGSEAQAEMTEAHADEIEAQEKDTKARAEQTEAPTDVTESKIEGTETQAEGTEAQPKEIEAQEKETGVELTEAQENETGIEVTEPQAEGNGAQEKETETQTAVTETQAEETETKAEVTEAQAGGTEIEVTEAQADVTESKTEGTETQVEITEAQPKETEAQIEVTEAQPKETEAQEKVTGAEEIEEHAEGIQVRAEVTEAQAEATETQTEGTEAQVKEIGSGKTDEHAEGTEAQTEDNEVQPKETDAQENETGVEEAEAQAEGTAAQEKETETQTAVTETQSEVTETQAEITETLAESTETQAEITGTQAEGTATQPKWTEAQVKETGAEKTGEHAEGTEAHEKDTEAQREESKEQPKETKVQEKVTGAEKTEEHEGTEAQEKDTAALPEGTDSKTDGNETPADGTEAQPKETDAQEKVTGIEDTEAQEKETGIEETEAQTEGTESQTKETEAHEKVTGREETEAQEKKTGMEETEAQAEGTEAQTKETEAQEKETGIDQTKAQPEGTEAQLKETEAQAEEAAALADVTDSKTEGAEMQADVTEAQEKATGEDGVEAEGTETQEKDTETLTAVTETQAEVTETQAEVTEAQTKLSEAEESEAHTEVTEEQTSNKDAKVINTGEGDESTTETPDTTKDDPERLDKEPNKLETQEERSEKMEDELIEKTDEAPANNVAVAKLITETTVKAMEDKESEEENGEGEKGKVQGEMAEAEKDIESSHEKIWAKENSVVNNEAQKDDMERKQEETAKIGEIEATGIVAQELGDETRNSVAEERNGKKEDDEHEDKISEPTLPGEKLEETADQESETHEQQHAVKQEESDVSVSEEKVTEITVERQEDSVKDVNDDDRKQDNFVNETKKPGASGMLALEDTEIGSNVMAEEHTRDQKSIAGNSDCNVDTNKVKSNLAERKSEECAAKMEYSDDGEAKKDSGGLFDRAKEITGKSDATDKKVMDKSTDEGRTVVEDIVQEDEDKTDDIKLNASEEITSGEVAKVGTDQKSKELQTAEKVMDIEYIPNMATRFNDEELKTDAVEEMVFSPETLVKQDEGDLVTSWINKHQASRCFQTFIEPLDDLNGFSSNEIRKSETAHILSKSECTEKRSDTNKKNTEIDTPVLVQDAQSKKRVYSYSETPPKGLFGDRLTSESDNHPENVEAKGEQKEPTLEQQNIKECTTMGNVSEDEVPEHKEGEHTTIVENLGPEYSTKSEDKCSDNSGKDAIHLVSNIGPAGKNGEVIGSPPRDCESQPGGTIPRPKETNALDAEMSISHGKSEKNVVNSTVCGDTENNSEMNGVHDPVIDLTSSTEYKREGDTEGSTREGLSMQLFPVEGSGLSTLPAQAQMITSNTE